LASSRDLLRVHDLTNTTDNTLTSLIVHVGIVVADTSVFFLLVVGIVWTADTRRLIDTVIFGDVFTENALIFINTIILIAIFTGLAASWSSSIVKEGISRTFCACLRVIIEELVLLIAVNTSILVGVKVLIQVGTIQALSGITIKEHIFVRAFNASTCKNIKVFMRVGTGLTFFSLRVVVDIKIRIVATGGTFALLFIPI